MFYLDKILNKILIINEKKKIYIPNQNKSASTGHKAKKQKKVYTPSADERVSLADAVMNNTEIDVRRLSVLVNMNHLLADVNEQLAMEAEEILKQVDSQLQLELRHPISRIKIHASEMVRFVDKHTNETFSEGFGYTADRLKEVVMDFAKEIMPEK